MVLDSKPALASIWTVFLIVTFKLVTKWLYSFFSTLIKDFMPSRKNQIIMVFFKVLGVSNSIKMD